MKESRFQDYKGYWIGAWALGGQSALWYARGDVNIVNPNNVLVPLKTFQPRETTYPSKEEAENHAIELCKEWVDQMPQVMEGRNGKFVSLRSLALFLLHRRGCCFLCRHFFHAPL